VCCFSAKENNLNQWRAYGRGEGGYSIGFRTAELGSSLGINTILTPVLYKRDVQARLVQDVLAWALEEYLKVSHKYDGVDQEKHRKLWSHHFLFFAAGAAPVMKNPDFCEEREWRVVRLLGAKADCDFLPKATGLVPYVELRIGKPRTPTNESDRKLPDRLPIQRLWSGPGTSNRVSLLAGRTLLEKLDYPPTDLAASDIPYRVG
jgi:Protein of unknown function (DUF2971)